MFIFAIMGVLCVTFNRTISSFQTFELKHVNSNQCLGKASSHDHESPSIGKLPVFKLHISCIFQVYMHIYWSIGL